MKFSLNECINKLVNISYLEDGEKISELIMIYNKVDYNNLSELIDELIKENILIDYYIK